MTLVVPAYGEVLHTLKQKIRQAQVKAALAVNTEMVLLYWEIGQTILHNQAQEGWGTKVIDQLSQDLSSAFPDMKGFSPRNLKYMRKLAETYPDLLIVQQVVAQLPWGHNVRILDKVESENVRLWYANQAITNGWSRNMMVHHIETNLYQRQHIAEKTTNYKARLPALQSDLAEQILKDPYNFDFLTIGAMAHEKDIEKQLVEHITTFLLELGTGFAFVGKQYRLEVSNTDYFIDLLFYHVKLHCYVVIELKAGEFKPEYAGKLNFYLSAVDDLVKQPEDNPSIGIILCRTKDKVLAEYALRDMTKPIGVSEYILSEAIPKELQSSLPTIEALEAELSGER